GYVDKTQTGAGNSVSPTTAATATTSQASELLLGSIGVETKKDDPFVAGAGYTALPNIGTGVSLSPDSNMAIDPEYRIVAATGSYLANGSINPARNWAATIVTFQAAVCGNGVLEAAETCDDGNLASGDCCSSACAIEAAGTVCRAAAGVCDVQETCTGSSSTCPNDAKSTAVCRPAAGICDVEETCTGSSSTCPNDAKSTAVCRAAAGICDLAESCDGVSNSCPADSFVAGGTTCRAAAGICDVAEKCTGSSA